MTRSARTGTSNRQDRRQGRERAGTGLAAAGGRQCLKGKAARQTTMRKWPGQSADASRRPGQVRDGLGEHRVGKEQAPSFGGLRRETGGIERPNDTAGIHLPIRHIFNPLDNLRARQNPTRFPFGDHALGTADQAAKRLLSQSILVPVIGNRMFHGRISFIS